MRANFASISELCVRLTSASQSVSSPSAATGLIGTPMKPILPLKEHFEMRGFYPLEVYFERKYFAGYFDPLVPPDSKAASETVATEQRAETILDFIHVSLAPTALTEAQEVDRRRKEKDLVLVQDADKSQSSRRERERDREKDKDRNRNRERERDFDQNARVGDDNWRARGGRLLGIDNAGYVNDKVGNQEETHTRRLGGRGKDNGRQDSKRSDRPERDSMATVKDRSSWQMKRSVEHPQSKPPPPPLPVNNSVNNFHHELPEEFPPLPGASTVLQNRSNGTTAMSSVAAEQQSALARHESRQNFDRLRGIGDFAYEDNYYEEPDSAAVTYKGALLSASETAKSETGRQIPRITTNDQFCPDDEPVDNDDSLDLGFLPLPPTLDMSEQDDFEDEVIVFRPSFSGSNCHSYPSRIS